MNINEDGCTSLQLKSVEDNDLAKKKAVAVHLLVLTNYRTNLLREKAKAFRVWQSVLTDSENITLQVEL